MTAAFRTARCKGMPNPTTGRAARLQAMLAVAGLMLVLASPAAALDDRYVDRDGDLVADTPARTIDPATLLFAYTPGEDPAHYPRVWEGFLQHLEKVTGKRVRFFPAQSNTAQIEAMR